MKLTTTDIQQNQQFYITQDLSKLSVVELRTIFRRCGGRHIKRDGDYLNAATVRKPELLSAINEILAPTKLLANASFDKVEYEFQVDEFYITSESLFAELKEAMALESKALIVNKITDIVANLNTLIVAKHPGKEDFNKRNNVRASYMRELRKLITEADTITMDSAFGYYKTIMSTFSKRDNAIIFDKSREYVEHRKENPVSYDFQGLFTWAKHTIENSRRWEEIALALGYLTGRRIASELLTTATEYEIIHGELYIRGLAKQKTMKLVVEWQKFPCIDPNLVALGLEKIASRRMKVENPEDLIEVSEIRKVANRKYESSLRNTSKQLLKFGITKTHALRAAYAEYHTQLIGIREEKIKEAERILGHKSISSPSGHYIN
jgi:hypothetical protein